MCPHFPKLSQEKEFLLLFNLYDTFQFLLYFMQFSINYSTDVMIMFFNQALAWKIIQHQKWDLVIETPTYMYGHSFLKMKAKMV